MDLHTAHTQMCSVNSYTSFWRVDKLQKSTISFFMSVRLYARNKSAPIGRFSVKILYRNSLKSVEKTKYAYNLTKITGSLLEDLSVFLIISHWILPECRKLSEKVVTNIKHVCHSKYLKKKKFCYGIITKNTKEPDRPQMIRRNMAEGMLDLHAG